MPAGALIALPSVPVAPSSFEYSPKEIVGVTTAIFNDAQQFQDWGPGATEISVSWPPMTAAQAVDWKTFLGALKGQLNYFQFGSAFTVAYPEFSGKNWRLKTNQPKWDVQGDRMYRITFECREAF